MPCFERCPQRTFIHPGVSGLRCRAIVRLWNVHLVLPRRLRSVVAVQAVVLIRRSLENWKTTVVPL